MAYIEPLLLGGLGPWCSDLAWRPLKGGGLRGGAIYVSESEKMYLVDRDHKTLLSCDPMP